MGEKKIDRNREIPDHNQEVMSRGVPLKRSAFLAAYAKTCNIMRAAQAAGIDRRTNYGWLKDAKYEEQFLEAQEIAISTLEDETVKRATMGGSDTLLIFLLKAARPQKYRDRVRQEITGADGIPLAPTQINILPIKTPTDALTPLNPEM